MNRIEQIKKNYKDQEFKHDDIDYLFSEINRLTYELDKSRADHIKKISELEEQAKALVKAVYIGSFRIGKLTNGYVTNEIQKDLAIEDYHKLNQALEAYEAWKVKS